MKNIGLIGCGNIAETYFRAQDYFNNINFIACADKFPEAAKKCADQYKIKSSTVDEVLNDSEVDVDTKIQRRVHRIGELELSKIIEFTAKNWWNNENEPAIYEDTFETKQKILTKTNSKAVFN